MSKTKRYVIVGTGGRAVTFVDGIANRRQRYNVELVGLCDNSRTRMDWHNRRMEGLHGLAPVPTFEGSEFGEMVRQTCPDTVVVCTTDGTHHRYIIDAMSLGCDVICEKPMTTDGRKAETIFEAIESSGRSLRVAFNCRFIPYLQAVRRLIVEGAVGQPLAVDLQWMLDTTHGADYFRRWHAQRSHSGGLLVHKATHHFDLINWWVDSRPHTVMAMGDLKFYGRDNADARGERYDYDRYTGVEAAKGDPFALRLDQHDTLRGLYLHAEQDDGYIRDRNVFGTHIDIEDTMSVLVRYRNGVHLTYSLVAYSPWEGFRVSITGTKGRLELHDQHSTQGVFGRTSETPLVESEHHLHLRVYPMFGQPYGVPVMPGAGGHGGGDDRMLDQLLSPTPLPDPLRAGATAIDGAASLLVGACANESIRSQNVVHCDSVLPVGDWERRLRLGAEVSSTAKSPDRMQPLLQVGR